MCCLLVLMGGTCSGRRGGSSAGAESRRGHGRVAEIAGNILSLSQTCESWRYSRISQNKKRSSELLGKDDGYQGKQHCAYMRCAKLLKASEIQINDMQMSAKSLEDVWNRDKVREGDRVGESAEKK